jgi:hypothetical protein
MRKFNLFVYSLALEPGNKNINLNLFYSYAIVTNTRVGIIRGGTFNWNYSWCNFLINWNYL